MGTIFSVPIYRSPNLLFDLARLKCEWNIELAATVLDADAESLAVAAGRGERLGILFGSEPCGLDRETVDACDQKGNHSDEACATDSLYHLLRWRRESSCTTSHAGVTTDLFHERIKTDHESVLESR